MPMTAWLMAHRLGHAIRKKNNTWDHFTSEVERDFGRISTEAYHMGEVSYEALLTLANAVGTMRSARMGNLRNFYEFNYELLAQRLLTGHIKFNPLPRCIRPDRRMAWGNPIGRQYCADPEELREWDYVLEGYVDQYEYILDHVMESLVGKMYVM